MDLSIGLGATQKVMPHRTLKAKSYVNSMLEATVSIIKSQNIQLSVKISKIEKTSKIYVEG